MEKKIAEINDQMLQSLFPDICEQEARAALLEHGTIMRVRQGDRMMEIGQHIRFMPLVVSGSLKVMREDQDGNELLLYYVQPGETCAMSLTCCMRDARSSVRAVAEEDTLILAIPVRYMDEWTSVFKSFKQFVMLTYQRRYDELLQTIDGIAFQRLDDRLLHALRDKSRAQANAVVHTTHQELANELNSSREVISRVLKQMERKNLVRLGRNRIELLVG